MSVPAVSVVIVTWQAEDVLAECLQSIDRQDFAGGIETVVFDNASTDRSVEIARSSHVPIRVVASPENLGFGRGNNEAIREARGELLLFLNPDTVLTSPRTIASLVDLMRREDDIGIVAPRLLNLDGTVQPSVAVFTSPLSAFVIAFGLHRLMRGRLRDRWAPADGSPRYSRDVDWVKGAVVLISAATFRRVGGWSTQSFMYAEDQQLCWDVRQLGQRVRFDPSISVVHLDDHASSKRWNDAEKAAEAARATCDLIRSRYGPAQSTFTIGCCWARYVIRKWVATRAGRPRDAHVHRATADVFRRAFLPRLMPVGDASRKQQ